MTPIDKLGLGDLVERLRTPHTLDIRDIVQVRALLHLVAVDRNAAADAITTLRSELSALIRDNESYVEANSGLLAERDSLMDQQRWPREAEFQYGDWVEKFTGEARWDGRVVSAYHTKRLALRYVVEVEPQGFQMIAVPAQLRRALSHNKENGV